MTTPEQTSSRGLGVRDVMTSPVVTARASTTLDEVVRLMLERRVGCVVIADDDDHPLGIVTEMDFKVADDTVPMSGFHWPTVLGHFVWSEESLQEVYAKAVTEPAAAIMSTPVITIDEDAHLWEAVELLARNTIRRLPVVKDGRLVGIVTSRDMLKFAIQGSSRTSS